MSYQRRVPYLKTYVIYSFVQSKTGCVGIGRDAENFLSSLTNWLVGIDGGMVGQTLSERVLKPYNEPHTSM